MPYSVGSRLNPEFPHHRKWLEAEVSDVVRMAASHSSILLTTKYAYYQ